MTPRIAPAELDLLLQRMWVPDDVRVIDGWQVRTARGVTKRANSVLPHGTPLNLDMALQLVERLYRAKGLPPVVQVTPSALPAGLDAVLDARGYERVDEALVMVADLDDVLAAAGERTRPVHAAGSPDEAYQRLAYETPQRAAVMTDIGRRTPSVYASMRHDGRAYATGRGSLVDGWLGITQMVTDPSSRRRGLATDVVAELARRAHGGGARAAVLQVLADNAPAIALYTRLGFAEHSRYHYRVLRGTPAVDRFGAAAPIVPLGGPAPQPPTAPATPSDIPGDA